MPNRHRATPRSPFSENDLQRCVIETAQLLGYRVSHFRAAQRKDGQWRTPVEADGKGWPDLTLAKPGRLIFAELKSDRGRLSEAQAVWLEALTASSTDVEVYVWRPADWLDGTVETVLRDTGWLAGLRPSTEGEAA